MSDTTAVSQVDGREEFEAWAKQFWVSPSDQQDVVRFCRSAFQAARAQDTELIRTLTEALRNVSRDVEEWCEAVQADASWDGWDSCYKGFAYNGGLDEAKAALTAAEERLK